MNSNIFKFRDTDNCKLFITGCPHVGHKQPFIWEKRGYVSPEAHTKGVIDKINEVCRSTDILFVLGDFCLNTSREEFLQYIKDINCELWFIDGNHPNPWKKMYLEHCDEKFGYQVVKYKWLNKITYWGHYVEMVWNNKSLVANHYPFYVFNAMQHGCWSLVSHSHGTCSISLPTDLTMKQLDCGWDVHFKPLSFEEIKQIMDKKGICVNDSHDKHTSSGGL